MAELIKFIFEIFGIIAYIACWNTTCKSIEDKDKKYNAYEFALFHCITLIVLFLYIWVEN